MTNQERLAKLNEAISIIRDVEFSFEQGSQERRLLYKFVVDHFSLVGPFVNLMDQLKMDAEDERQEQERLKVEILKERQQAAANDPTITLGDELDSKDIYLETFIGPGKIRQVVGLHAVGHAGPYEYDLIGLDQSRTRMKSNFMALEVWGNEYDTTTGKMIGRGSFRVHNSDLDNEVKQWEAEGWTRCGRPGTNESKG